MSNDEVGKSEWVRSVVDRYGGALARYALLHTGNREAAQDVVQDTFAQLCAEDPCHLNSHLAQWLFTVCRNRALDVQRKESRIKPFDEDRAILLADHALGPAFRAEQRNEISEILDIMARLPKNQQEVLRLKFQNGLSYKEISNITGLSVSNIGFLIHSAIKTIRREADVHQQK
jgi:RNA polymerase sigma factor (sigma-70 family)